MKKGNVIEVQLNDAPKDEEVMSVTFMQKIAIHISAGAVAGIISRTATAPLDRIKIMSQLLGKKIKPMHGVKMMVKDGGFRSLWQGNGLNLMRVVPEIACKFFFYNKLKDLFQSGPTGTFTESLLAGSFTGALVHTLLFPMEVVRTRLLLSSKKSPSRKMMKQLKMGVKTEGWQFLFLGFMPSLIGKTIFSTVDLTTYQTALAFYPRKDGSSIPHGYGIILCGLLSSFFASIMYYPFGVITVNQQAVHPRHRKKVMAFVKSRGGMFGLYHGISNSLLKGMPSYAIAYFCYELTIEAFGEARIV